MKIHFFLSLFPMEALIASQLPAEEFGAYMTMGPDKLAGDRMIFVELRKGDFGGPFDWKSARDRCVRHPDGRRKHSVYLSVYRTLEHVPLELFGALHLVTCDGRSLAIAPIPCSGTVEDMDSSGKVFLYQELCPLRPLVVSRLAPIPFLEHATGVETSISVPQLAFADLKMVDFGSLDNTGSIAYRNMGHLKACVEALALPGKPAKTVDRSHIESFSYRNIGRGIFAGNFYRCVFYPMPCVPELRRSNYDWAKSAQIL